MLNSCQRGGSPRGNALGFLWPPEPIADELGDGHAAPGKLAMVARLLIDRALARKQSATAPSHFIHAALLASDAAELLSGRTPDMTLSALQTKLECEVRAECTFLGAGFHFDVERRIKELELEVESIGKCSSDGIKSIDAGASILNEIVRAYTAAGRIEEQNRCLVQFRKLNRKMNRPKRQRLAPKWPIAWPIVWLVDWLSHGVLVYGEFLLASFARYMVLFASWTIIFIVLYGWLSGKWSHQTVSWVYNSFIGGNPAGSEETRLIHVLSWIAVPIGLFHIGILISFMYSLISRK